MGGGKIGLTIDPSLGTELLERPPPRCPQGPVDQFAGCHGKAWMHSAEALREGAVDLVVVAALTRRLDQPRPEDNVLMAAAAIKVVVLQEHGCRQHDVGPAGGLRHDLLMNADEQVLARQAAFTP